VRRDLLEKVKDSFSKMKSGQERNLLGKIEKIPSLKMKIFIEKKF
jgi:hypothetical protein